MDLNAHITPLSLSGGPIFKVLLAKEEHRFCTWSPARTDQANFCRRVWQTFSGSDRLRNHPNVYQTRVCHGCPQGTSRPKCLFDFPRSEGPDRSFYRTSAGISGPKRRCIVPDLRSRRSVAVALCQASLMTITNTIYLLAIHSKAFVSSNQAN